MYDPRLEEIKGWNWGAFMFNWMWGIANDTYLPLLCLIPVFNLVWVFVCGFKGNEWAWRNSAYQDVETFNAVQRTWNRAGLVQVIIVVGVFILYGFLFESILGTLGNW